MTGVEPGFDMFSLPTGQILRSHPESSCIAPCPLHSPSDHPMRDWPLLWRSDRRLFERICPHGTGHPDPDHVAFADPDGTSGVALHGCDMCCWSRSDG